LRGEYGSPEFHASYNEAVARRIAPPDGLLAWVLNAYEKSEEFLGRKPSTQRGYKALIKRIDKDFGDLPLKLLSDRRTRGEFLDWRDHIAQTSGRRQADYAWSVLALILAWALNRGKIVANPCTNGGRLYKGSRRDRIWTPADEATFLKGAPAHLHLALLLALWTGQRQGDLLRLPWSAYDGKCIRLRQGKTGEYVMVPAGAPLKAALDQAAKDKRSTIILINSDAQPWTSDGFRASWRKACAKAGIAELTFHDLRGSAVTRLAIAGCTVPEIATITGHSLQDVHAILNANYLHRDPALAESAIRKLEAAQENKKA